MQGLHPRLAGVELYFDDLPKAKAFYTDVLGLPMTEDQEGHHAKLETGTAFEPCNRSDRRTWCAQSLNQPRRGQCSTIRRATTLCSFKRRRENDPVNARS